MSSSIRPLAIERLPSVIKRTGLSKSAIYRLMAERRFPQSIPLHEGNTRGWDTHAVSDWIKRTIAAGSKGAQ
jgi:prophage regulatory protein